MQGSFASLWSVPSIRSIPSIPSGEKVYPVIGKGLFRLFSLFGPFRHKMGRWAPKIYPVIATVIIAVAVVVIIVNNIVMLIVR